MLYHLVPTPMNSLTETMFLRGLSDKTLLAHDLQVFELPQNLRRSLSAETLAAFATERTRICC